MARKEQNYISLLEGIASKYNLSTIKEKIIEAQERKIKIGFLGEFNSGKSSLVNALLGKEILPAMERPTTKNIITIVPDSSVDVPKFYEEKDNKIIPIEPLDFQEIALGRKEGSALVKVPPSEYLPEGFQIIDTPGIASLEKMDIEITLGYLPELDAAVVCQDITFGTIPKSVLDFLRRPEIRVIADKLIFALTKADRILPTETEKVKEHSASVIQELYSSLGIKVNAEQRVFVTSAKLALEGKREYVKDFMDGLKKEIISKSEELKKERLIKELKKIAEELVETLESLIEQAKPDTSEVDEKIKKLEKEISAIEREKRKLLRKLERIEVEIAEKIMQILQAYKVEVVSASSEEELRQTISKIEQELRISVKDLVAKRLQTLKTSSLVVKEAVQRVQEEIAVELKKIEILKTILTAVLFAAVAPGTGAASNAVEGAIGTVISRFKGFGKVVGKFGKFLKVAGEIIRVINPVELLVDPMARRYLESRYSDLVPKVADSVSEGIRKELERILEEVFDDLEMRIKTNIEALNELQERKLRTLQEVKLFKEEAKKDIELLKSNFWG